MPVRPTLLHRMALVSFLLFRKNLGKLREFFGQMVYRPPWQKVARTPMVLIRWFVSKALHSFIRILTQTARENYPVRRTFYDVNHVHRMGLSGFFFYPKQGRGYKPCMTSLWSSPKENLTLATEQFYL